ncbi:uncharacterized protein ACIB01_008980 isoform 1-T1 [Guaruba guarouba]
MAQCFQEVEHVPQKKSPETEGSCPQLWEFCDASFMKLTKRMWEKEAQNDTAEVEMKELPKPVSMASENMAAASCSSMKKGCLWLASRTCETCFLVSIQDTRTRVVISDLLLI